MPQEIAAETSSPTADGTRRPRKARRRREELNTPHAGRGMRHLLPESLRHMQELFELLPHLKLDANGEPDPRATDETVLERLSTHAQASAAAMNLGMSAVGSLMACAAPECEDKSISADAIEAVGWLLAELGATTALMIRLARACAPTPEQLAR